MIYHEHQEHVSREHAAALAQATGELGQGKVTALANEGDPFITTRGRESVVRDGYMLIKLSGDFPADSTDPVYERARQIQQDQVARTPEATK